MLAKLFVIALVLMCSPVVTSQKAVIDCELRTVITGGQDVEGMPVSGDLVEVTLPCLDKIQIEKIILRLDRHDQQTTNAINAIERGKRARLTVRSW